MPKYEFRIRRNELSWKTITGSRHSRRTDPTTRSTYARCQAARCRKNFADTHVSHLFSEVIAKDRIAVAEEEARELGKRKCFPYLLCGPLRGRMSGHIEMQDEASVMGQHQKHVKYLEADRRHREEVD